MRVGFIGLGVMGANMARHLAAAGQLSCIWNRTRATADELGQAIGVPVADSPAELAKASDVIITCVSADKDILEIIDSIAPVLDDRHTVIDTSTVGADTAEIIGERLAQTGTAFLDAPLTGGSEGAEAGTLVVMVGGEAAVLEAMRPVLEPFASRISHFGPVGNGQRAKAVNQVIVAGVVQAISDGLSFAAASGLDTDELLPVLVGGAASSRLLERRGARLLDEDFAPGFKMALHHKDLLLCQRLLKGLDVSLPTVEMTIKHYERLMAEGYGEEDVTALYRLKKSLFETGNQRSL